MAMILVIEEEEMKLIVRALDQYKKTIFTDDDLDNDKGQADKILQRLKGLKGRKYKGGREL